MKTVDVTSNQKGSIGEALIIHGQTIPSPISQSIEKFVEQEYEVAQNTPVQISQERATYLNVVTEDGDSISTRTDGGFSAKWIPAHRESEITKSRDGYIRGMYDLMDESAFFPVEVKSGEYAELERSQREVLKTVARANTRQHPMIVDVQIDKLPEQYELSVRFV